MSSTALFTKRSPFQGQIQDFLKKGGAHIKGLQNFGAWGDRGCLRGMCPLRSEEKIAIFKVNSHDLVHSFLPGAPTKSGPLSLQKIEGAHAGCAPL